MSTQIFVRIVNAAKLAVVGMRYPLVVRNMPLLVQLLEYILKIAEEGKPMMCKIGVIVPDEETHAIVSLWAGPGADANPLKRIDELLAENRALREALRQTKESLIQ